MRDHKMKNPDGTVRGIPCDKVKIGQLTWTMLQSKLSYMLGDDQIAEYRLWLALVPHFMQGLPDSGAALKASRSSGHGATEVEDAVKDFLSTYHFKTANDEEGRGESGLTPLMHAAMVGNVEVAAGLIEQGANVQSKLRKFSTTTGMDIGMTALHFAVAACPARHVEMITVLLRAGADANAPAKSGGTPLMASVMFHSVLGLRALLKCAKGSIDLERSYELTHATALGIAAFLGTPELCEIIIKAGASRTQMNDRGGTKLTDACQNVATTVPMLELLWNNGELDINAVMQSTTVSWSMIDIYFQLGIKGGLISKSQFTMVMAHIPGSTPLHNSAKNGLVAVTEWLLEHGAHKSLHVRNKMGATPLDMARIFGPYPAIEAKLGAAMLNHQFDMQFAIRRGSLLRKQAGGAVEPGDDGDDVSSDERRSAEPTVVETITDDEDVRTGDEATVEEESAVGTPTSPSAAARGKVQTPTTIDSFTVADLGAALTELSGSVKARFDEQAARFDEQTVRSNEQAVRLVSMQTENAQLHMQNTEIMAKLDVLLGKTAAPASTTAHTPTPFVVD